MRNKVTRRNLLGAGAYMTGAVAAQAAVPRSMRALLENVPQDGKELPSKLVLNAVDAARHAGAEYADVRITRNMSTILNGIGGSDHYRFVCEQELAIGVRALVNGYWGFASGPYWTMDESERLSREAVAQARLNARGKSRAVVLADRPTVSGKWATPVKIDPFAIPGEELDDFQRSWSNEVDQYERATTGMSSLDVQFSRSEKMSATTDGSLFSQTLYTMSANFNVSGGASGISLPRAGAGWEYIQEADPFGQVARLMEGSRRERQRMRSVPVEVGKYDVVLDGSAMAALLAETIGPATQLDRALGYEANASGTSFLRAPLEMLGTRMIAAPLVTVTADRTMPRGLSTVQWDEEGVLAGSFPLVQDGRLVDYQTTREQASWLVPYYERMNQPVVSRGCASVYSALKLPIQHTPNLTLAPGPDDIGFDHLVTGVKRGLAIRGLRVTTDFQIWQGSGVGSVREIVNGKLGATVVGAGILFNTEELWKSIKILGGKDSSVSRPFSSYKGEPRQQRWFTARAVPALITDVSVYDVQRKA